MKSLFCVMRTGFWHILVCQKFKAFDELIENPSGFELVEDVQNDFERPIDDGKDDSVEYLIHVGELRFYLGDKLSYYQERKCGQKTDFDAFYEFYSNKLSLRRLCDLATCLRGRRKFSKALTLGTFLYNFRSLANGLMDDGVLAGFVSDGLGFEAEQAADFVDDAGEDCGNGHERSLLSNMSIGFFS